MVVTAISNAIDIEWLDFQPVRVGGVPKHPVTPDRCVTASEGDNRLLRVDVYAYGPDCFAFEDAIAWHDQLIVGFGSHVHAVALKDRSVVTIDLGGYFGHLYPTVHYLLVATEDRLFRIEPDRSIAWKSDVLGIDGVVVSNPGPPTIVGEGEWDPPGGWRPFSVLSANGEIVR